MLDSLKKNLDPALLTKAISFLEQHPDTSKPVFAESSHHQGVEMANLLLDLKCDPQTITAALIFPTVINQKIDEAKVIQLFDAPINKLINGTKRMESLHRNHAKSQIENVRKMLLAIVDDVRVVLIKLAERLAVLKYLKHCTAAQQQAVADETIHIYAPLANRLGVGQIKWQIEDLSFRYLNSEEYKKISKALNMRRADREIFIEDMMQQLQKLFNDAHMTDIQISGRAKHIYSIHRKMHKKHVDFTEIYDTSAFRIIVPELKDCYMVLGIVHSTWPHIPKEFDDYIAKPKPNGYQSIHTVAVGPHNINVEIQIRTRKMHEAAELGVAAHWKYKEGATQQNTYETKINWLREVLDWQKEISDESNDGENLYAKVFEDRVYVFTPAGEIFDLPANATPLDFAYYIHSDLGNRCRGAKVNNVLVPLTYKLKTGDRVQILTAKTGHPSRDWLNAEYGYVTSTVARNKIKQWFKKQFYQENLATGLEVWEKISRREGVAKAQLNRIARELSFKTADDLLAALGAGDMNIATILNHAKNENVDDITTIATTEQQIINKILIKPKDVDISTLTIEGVGNLLTQLGRCCKPIPGDPIIGYITKGRGVTIHQQRCLNAQQARMQHPERMIQVNWGSKKPGNYPVDLVIEAHDRSGLIRDISSVMANEKIKLLGLNSHINRINNTANIYLTIEIDNLDTLQRIFSQLRHIPDVHLVDRR